MEATRSLPLFRLRTTLRVKEVENVEGEDDVEGREEDEAVAGGDRGDLLPDPVRLLSSLISICSGGGEAEVEVEAEFKCRGNN